MVVLVEVVFRWWKSGRLEMELQIKVLLVEFAQWWNLEVEVVEVLVQLVNGANGS
jgi:hypothetical protein